MSTREGCSRQDATEETDQNGRQRQREEDKIETEEKDIRQRKGEDVEMKEEEIEGKKSGNEGEGYT